MPLQKKLSVAEVMEWRVIVGDLIREERLRLKWTQADLAHWLGWSRTSIIAIEKGDQAVSLDQLLRLAACMNCHVADLLPGEVPRDGRQRY